MKAPLKSQPPLPTKHSLQGAVVHHPQLPSCSLKMPAGFPDALRPTQKTGKREKKHKIQEKTQETKEQKTHIFGLIWRPGGALSGCVLLLALFPFKIIQILAGFLFNSKLEKEEKEEKVSYSRIKREKKKKKKRQKTDHDLFSRKLEPRQQPEGTQHPFSVLVVTKSKGFCLSFLALDPLPRLDFTAGLEERERARKE